MVSYVFDKDPHVGRGTVRAVCLAFVSLCPNATTRIWTSTIQKINGLQPPRLMRSIKHQQLVVWLLFVLAMVGVASAASMAPGPTQSAVPFSSFIFNGYGLRRKMKGIERAHVHGVAECTWVQKRTWFGAAAPFICAATCPPIRGVKCMLWHRTVSASRLMPPYP